MGSILGLEDPLEEGMENPMGGGTWQAMVHRVAKNQTLLNQFGTHSLIDKAVDHGLCSHLNVV